MKSIRHSIVVLATLAAAGATQPSVAGSSVGGHIQIGSSGHYRYGSNTRHYGHGNSTRHYGHGIKKHHGHGGHVDIRRLQRFYHHPYGYRPHDRRLYRHPYRHQPKLSYNYRSYRNYQSSNTNGYGGSSYRRACHPVSKLVHGTYGHSKRIGGTMCYDRFGYGYVVPGSRRVIGYN